MRRGGASSVYGWLPGVLAAVLWLGCSSSEKTPTIRRIFLITIDTLRADHMGAYGYVRETSPNFDQRAAEGVLFERAIAQWPKTGASLASIFTGQYPQTTGLTHAAALELPPAYLTLPEFLKTRGFTNVAVTSNAILSTRLGWSAGFDEYAQLWEDSDYSGDRVAYRELVNARRVTEMALEVVERHADAERLFAWLHYSDPHEPYILPGDVENPFLDDSVFRSSERLPVDMSKRRGGLKIGRHRDRRYYVAQYDANILFADRLVGSLLEELTEMGLLAESIVILTADHGQGFGEHEGYYRHGKLPYNDGLLVPLAFFGPAVEAAGRRVASPVELVDLYPTIRDLVAPGVEVPGLEGRSLVPFLRGNEGDETAEEFQFAFAEAGGRRPLRHFRSVQDQRWKLIYHPQIPSREEWWEFYDLSEDAGETRDLANAKIPAMRRLQRTLQAWMDGDVSIRRSRRTLAEKSEETRRALRALGYVD